MDSLFLLIPVTLIILGIAIWIFLWAVNNDQYDDMESPASRILFDDDEQATIDQFKKEQALKKQLKATKHHKEKQYDD